MAADRARRYLRSQGYFAAEIIPALGEGQFAQLRVEPGDRFLLGDVQVDTGSDPEAADHVRETLRLTRGQGYDADALLTAERAGLAALQEAGWPDATLAEALSKALLVLGESEGLGLVEAQPGCEALLVDADRGAWRTTGWDAVTAFAAF